MYSYGLLEPGCYYLIQEKPELSISLIKVTTETDQCMYIFTYDDQLSTGWRRKSDGIMILLNALPIMPFRNGRSSTTAMKAGEEAG
jgi:hypothetical protein